METTIVKRILDLLALLFALTMLFCLIGWYLGYNGLLLVGDLELPFLVRRLLKFIVFGIHTILIMGFILDIYDLKTILRCCIPYLCFHFILESVHQSFLTSGVLPCLFVIGLAIYFKRLKASLGRLLIINVALFCYQIITLVTKIGFSKIGYNTLNTYQWLVCSIDLIILLLLIYSKGGVVNYGRRKWKLVVFPRRVDNARYSHEGSGLCAETQEYLSLKGFERMFAMSLLLAIQVVQWTITLFACYLGNVFMEGLVITTSFIAHGFVIKKRWHSKNLVFCTLSSAAMFYVAARATIAFQYSQFFSIVVGLMLVYSLYRLVLLLDNREITKNTDKLDRLKILERRIEAAKKTVADIDKLL